MCGYPGRWNQRYCRVASVSSFYVLTEMHWLSQTALIFIEPSLTAPNRPLTSKQTEIYTPCCDILALTRVLE